MGLFGLADLDDVRDWMLVVSAPLSLWQAKTWVERSEGVHAWDNFCKSLTGPDENNLLNFQQTPLLRNKNGGSRGTHTRLSVDEGHDVLVRYAQNIKTNVVDPCTAMHSVKECFDTSNQSSYFDHSLSRVCYFSPPLVALSPSTLTPRTLTL